MATSGANDADAGNSNGADDDIEWQIAEHKRQQDETAEYVRYLEQIAESGIFPRPPSMLGTIEVKRERTVTVAGGGKRLITEKVALPDTTTTIDMADLVAMDLPPLRWLIDGLMPEGLTLLSAPPKIGKSRLVYQICVELAFGGTVLGKKVEQGAALYLALEDGARRAKDRTVDALAGRALPRGLLAVTMSTPLMGQGLEEKLAEWIEGRQAAGIPPRLIAIDTLQRVRPPTSGKRNVYEVDVEDMGKLQMLCTSYNVALLIVHHDKKGAEADFLARVSGSYGVAGSADTIMVLERARGQEYGKLHVTGRDCADATVGVRFDGRHGWQVAPSALAGSSPQRQAIYDCLLHSATALWPKAVADALDLERTSVTHTMRKMAEEGVITRTEHGYVVSDDASGIVH